jgi:hypothetical protein
MLRVNTLKTSIVPPQEMIEKVFRPSSLIDKERKTKEGSPTNLFLNRHTASCTIRMSRTRHGEVKFEPTTDLYASWA